MSLQHAIFLRIPVTWTLSLLVIAAPALGSETAWQALKDGGQVILMRHTTPEPGAGKGNPLVRDPTCAMERNLADRGKEEAARVGKAFKTRAIQIGEVLSSPYCRTQDTAR